MVSKLLLRAQRVPLPSLPDDAPCSINITPPVRAEAQARSIPDRAGNFLCFPARPLAPDGTRRIRFRNIE